MDTIKNYVETLFLELPKTPEVWQAKKELLTNMEDHYWALIDEGKSENEAIGAVISEFGSVDELKEALQISAEKQESGAEENPISEEEAAAFFAQRKESALGISIGAAGCILGTGGAGTLVSMGHGSFGAVFFLLFVAIGIGFLIAGGLKCSNSKKSLDDRFIPETVKNYAKERKESYHRSYQFSLVSGVGLCIFSIAAFIVAYSITFNEGIGISFFFGFVSAGVFLLIFGNVYHTGFNCLMRGKYFIADEGKIGPNGQRDMYGSNAEAKYRFLRLYWPIVTAIFLLSSFVMHSWRYAWIIFAVAGVLYGGISGVLKKE